MGAGPLLLQMSLDKVGDRNRGGYGPCATLVSLGEE